MRAFSSKHANIAALMAVQAAVLLPFRFVDGFGERDCYRMLLGLTDTLTNHAIFDSSLLYNRNASFGYYALLYALTPITGGTPQALTDVMNWIGLLSAVLFVVPEYLLVERVFGREVALVSGVVLAITPVWWYCGLYGHPITTAMLLFFCALAILSAYKTTPPARTRIAVVLLLTAALTIRLDTVLLFVVLAGVLLACRKVQLAPLLAETSLYVFVPLAGFAAAQTLLPGIGQGPGADSIPSLLATYHNLSRFVPGIRDSIIILAPGFTPPLLFTLPLTALLFCKKRNYPELAMVSGAAAVNLFFWLPNPAPARHYLMMAPAISISAAVAMLWLTSRARLRWPSAAVAAIAASVVVILGASEAGQYGKYGGYFRPLFRRRFDMSAQIEQARRVAAGLVSTPELPTPVIVLCDSNLVAAEIQKIAPETRVKLIVADAGPPITRVHEVRLRNNDFYMLEQSWEKERVHTLDSTGHYSGLPVLQASYLSIPYHGARPRLRLDAHLPAASPARTGARPGRF